jgi:hypothetical protein
LRRTERRDRRSTVNRTTLHDPIKNFLTGRGGWRNIRRAALKGLIKKLPFVGGLLEEVVFNAVQPRPEVDAALAKLESDLRDPLFTDDAAVDAFVRTLEDLVRLAGLSAAHQEELFLNMQAGLCSRLEEIQEATLSIEEMTAAILAMLTKGSGGGREVAGLLKKMLSAFEIQRLVGSALLSWPPAPILSQDPEASEDILKSILQMRDVIGRVQGIVEEVAEPPAMKELLRELRIQVNANLDHYAETQRIFATTGIETVVERWKGMPSSKSFLETVWIWCGLANHVARTVMEKAEAHVAAVGKND